MLFASRVGRLFDTVLGWFFRRDDSPAPANDAGLLARVSDALLALDRDWRVTYLNDRAAELLGKPATELTGRDLRESCPELTGGAFLNLCALAMGDQASCTIAGYAPGHAAWITGRLFPGPDGLTALLHRADDADDLPASSDAVPANLLADLTPVPPDGRLQDMARTLRMYRDADERDRDKERFLATLAHELKTPLTSMLGWAEVAYRSGDPRIDRQAIEVIARNARRQNVLITQLLGLCRLLNGRAPMDPQPLDAVREIELLVMDFLQEAADRGITLAFEAGADQLTVLADASLLDEGLSNLVQNALKFTPPGGTVTLAVRRDTHDCAIIEIRDTGQGIVPDQLCAIFEPFRQTEGSANNGGLGLGLAIVRNIVELHHGRITAASPGPGQGSTFTITLPLHTEAATPVQA